MARCNESTTRQYLSQGMFPLPPTWPHPTVKTVLWARLFLLILSLFTFNFGALCE